MSYTLLLQEGQTGEAWEPSKKQCSLGNRRALDRRVLSIFDFLPGSHWRITAEARLVDKWHCDRFFSEDLRFLPVSIVPPMLYTHLPLHAALPEQTD